jgi:hypothetical protein
MFTFGDKEVLFKISKRRKSKKAIYQSINLLKKRKDQPRVGTQEAYSLTCFV